MGGYSATDTQMQIQTDPYPSNVTSHASNLGGELERIRFQISAILGATTPDFWYADPPTDLTTLSTAIIPVGGVIDYHSSTPPTANWLLANGQAIGRSAYSALNALYSAASYPFGNGDGSTTFNLPNYQDRISIGVNSIVASAGATAGAQTHTLAAGEIPAGVPITITDPGHNHTQNAHNHGINDSGHTHSQTYWQHTIGGGVNDDAVISTSAFPSGPYNTRSLQSNTQDVTASGTTGISTQNTTPTNNSNTTGISAQTNGTGSAHSILNPVIGMYKMIRVL